MPVNSAASPIRADRELTVPYQGSRREQESDAALIAGSKRAIKTSGWLLANFKPSAVSAWNNVFQASLASFAQGKQAAWEGLLRRAPPEIAPAWKRAAWLAGWDRGFVEAALLLAAR